MMDEGLTRLSNVLALGDRIALKEFCDNTTVKQTRNKSTKRDQLLSALKTKISLPPNDKLSDSHGQSRMVGNRHAAKGNRRIQFGWMHNDRLVKDRTGGGTRKVPVNKNANRDELLEIGKQLFFKKGKSKRGIPSSNCQFEIRDFSHNTVSE